MATTSPGTLTATLSSITTPGTDFDFVVKATNAAGTSNQSTALRARASDPPQTPSPPTKVSADSTQIQIQWPEVTFFGYTALSGYKVYWNGGGNGSILSTPLYVTGSPATRSYTVNSGLTPGQSYSFKVSAYNDQGQESALSSILVVIAGTVPNKPDPVFRSGGGLNFITFSWNAPFDGNSAITGYTLLWNSGSGSVFSTIGSTGAATTSFT